LPDDHEIVRRGLRALLEARDDLVVCAEAADGRAAVDLTVQHTPDVAVLDLWLPVLNGIDATRQIRRSSPITEVLVFTMHESDEAITEALHAGARGYLNKSEVDAQIVNAVETLARHRPFSQAKYPRPCWIASIRERRDIRQDLQLASAKLCNSSPKATATRRSRFR